jgi:hypothetical protein
MRRDQVEMLKILKDKVKAVVLLDSAPLHSITNKLYLPRWQNLVSCLSN